MNEATGWTAVGMAAVSNMALWLKLIMDRRKSNGRNSRMCLDHEKRITTSEAEIKNMNTGFDLMRKENREDHQKIFGKLEELR